MECVVNGREIFKGITLDEGEEEKEPGAWRRMENEDKAVGGGRNRSHLKMIFIFMTGKKRVEKMEK